MSTKQYFRWSEIGKGPYFSEMRSIIETAFYGNNIYPVETIREAYKLACKCPGTVETDLHVYEPEATGLPADAKVLVFNDGKSDSRTPAARCILGSNDFYGNPVTTEKFGPIVREAIYQTRNKKLYHAQAYIGLSEEFMVRAHLCIPEGEENTMYSWLYNFQYITKEYYNMYTNSVEYEKEPDIYIFSDPQWSHPDFPMGLAFFAPEHNCACLLGLRYFGEHKKGTLTLGWGIANRNGFVSCHGGLKRYNLNEGNKFVLGVFGLSNSGKSTITHAAHNGKYDITILHDDAFVISRKDTTTVALEPAYFDKLQDYPMDCADNKYVVTVQNCGVTVDENGNKVLVTEDIRNKNGRAMKSRLWSPNRVDVFHEHANAIVWLMKDESLPPVIKISDPVLASTMGATLATTPASAESHENAASEDVMVMEPYANPFRTYPLSEDYEGFRELFANSGLDCYIFNTGYFTGKKVPKELTLECLEAIVENKAKFVSLGIEGLAYMPVDGFNPDFKNADYKNQLTASLKCRLEFIRTRSLFDELPEEALAAMNRAVEQAASL
ncbi:MAG: phosphoenolpyruvate carboxykinase (ATP) [Eubacteriales bacterium]